MSISTSQGSAARSCCTLTSSIIGALSALVGATSVALSPMRAADYSAPSEGTTLRSFRTRPPRPSTPGGPLNRPTPDAHPQGDRHVQIVDAADLVDPAARFGIAQHVVHPVPLPPVDLPDRAIRRLEGCPLAADGHVDLLRHGRFELSAQLGRAVLL